jgi:transposase
MDLGAFYGAYRVDGHGRPAYDPAMMVALLLYAYARGNRSSRGIERACVEDVACRVIAAHLVPDHSTLAEFRRRHELALADLFGEVLVLCRRAGLVDVAVLAVDGTKISASASSMANREYRQVALEILAEAERIDREEDERYGHARGDELPEHLRTAAGRRKALREAKERLARERAEQDSAAAGEQSDSELELRFDQEQIVARVQGRDGWLLDARRQLDDHRRAHPRPVPRDRVERLLIAEHRLAEELEVEREANVAYEAYRERGVMKDGRRFGGPPKPYTPPEEPEGRST